MKNIDKYGIFKGFIHYDESKENLIKRLYIYLRSEGLLFFLNQTLSEKEWEKIKDNKEKEWEKIKDNKEKQLDIILDYLYSFIKEGKLEVVITQPFSDRKNLGCFFGKISSTGFKKQISNIFNNNIIEIGDVEKQKKELDKLGIKYLTLYDGLTKKESLLVYYQYPKSEVDNYMKDIRSCYTYYLKENPNLLEILMMYEYHLKIPEGKWNMYP